MRSIVVDSGLLGKLVKLKVPLNGFKSSNEDVGVSIELKQSVP